MTTSYETETKVEKLLDKITSIAKTLSNKDARSLSERTLFRGEPECYKEVSSGLYRQLHEVKNINFDIMDAQERQLLIAKTYTKSTGKFEILSHIQHRGGKTNLIDFTTDLNIALFFACCHASGKDGRIIFFPDRDKTGYSIHSAIELSNMTDVQKSVFVIPIKGYIQEKDTIIVIIPSELKEGILKHLWTLYGMEAATVYNDLSGFIRDQEEFKDHEAEFYAGVSYDKEGEEGDVKKTKKAIEHYTNYLEHPNTLWRRGQVYYLRFRAYIRLGLKEKALDDYRNFRQRDWPGKPEVPASLKNKLEKMERKLVKETEEKEKNKSTEEEKLNLISRFLVRAYDEQGNSVSGVVFRIISESGYTYLQEITEEYADNGLLVTLPSVLYHHRDSVKNWLWFYKDGYTSINDILFQWGAPSEYTMKPIDDSQGTPEITIQVEPRLYIGEKIVSEEEASKLLRGL